MPALPPFSTDERALLKAVRNHAEFRRTLCDLSLTSDLTVLDQRVIEVVKCWFALAEAHLQEAKDADVSGNSRSAFSRAYYAAYNASKAVRYRAKGFVSLRGDDHEKAASELPADFPSLVAWIVTINALYEHRLRADYDNWRDTASEQTMLPAVCVMEAEKFIADCRTYLGAKFGMAL